MTFYGLPEELKAMWPRATNVLPAGFVDLISAGWAKLSASERENLIERLKAEPDSLQRALIAITETTKAAFS